jgi:hypothetical protein
VPAASYRKHGVRSTARPHARTLAPLRESSAGPSNQAPPMPDVEEEEEETATEAPREPPAASEDDNNNLYAQSQAHHLALEGVAEVPADVQAFLAQGLRSSYNNDDEYIELPEAMERAFQAAVDAKAVPSDTEPKP